MSANQTCTAAPSQPVSADAAARDCKVGFGWVDYDDPFTAESMAIARELDAEPTGHCWMVTKFMTLPQSLAYVRDLFLHAEAKPSIRLLSVTIWQDHNLVFNWGEPTIDQLW